jgi:hypothetical protein
MAKFSKKVMGKEVGEAKVYAKPHTMKGKTMNVKDAKLSVSRPPDPNSLAANKMKSGGQPAPRVSAGDPGADDVKTSGIKIRGTGAATKGVMARGPMA